MLFAIWLSPAQPFYLSLQKQIIQLANLYDAPVFMPHMTIFVGNSDNLDNVKEIFTKTLINFKPLLATASGIEHSDNYFKTLYVQFTNNELLKKLNKQLHSLDSNSDYTFNPHLSLLYKNLSQQTKQQLANEIWTTIEPKIISFDKIQLLSVSDEETKEAVEKWKIIESHSLMR